MRSSLIASAPSIWDSIFPMVSSIMAFDTRTGALRWATGQQRFDTWNTACLPGIPPNNCPVSQGEDWDFGDGAPLLLVPGPDGPVVVQAATSLASIDQELTELLTVLFLSGPLALVCALGGGYVLARKALAPVDRMVHTADQITATRLDRRIEVANADDELGRLARTLNGMIARLERSFEEIRRFTADAAHELRTPITVLRNEAEVALRMPREPEQYRTVLEDQHGHHEERGRVPRDPENGLNESAHEGPDLRYQPDQR